MFDDSILRLMAQIMQEGMTGYKIADLFNDTNKKSHFYNGEFAPPSRMQERKENYAYRFLSNMNEKGWDEPIDLIAKQLIDKSRIYFVEDDTHAYPLQKIRHLKEKISPKQGKSRNQLGKTHKKVIYSLLETIANGNMKEYIRQDLSDVENCISIGAWKSAIILCGSVLEAILSDWINQIDKEVIRRVFLDLYPAKKFKKTSDLSLEQLIDIAERIGLIHGYHATISDGIRNFRNLIHPNVLLRQKIEPNKAIAEIGKQIILAILQERRKIGNKN